MYDLIRTVEHLYQDGSECVLEVRAMKTEHDVKTDAPGVATVRNEGSEGSIHVNTFEQADRLHRALYAALEAAGHERPE